MLRRLTAGLFVVALAASGAAARSEKTLSYPRESVWPTMVRFLVVDERVKVIEKDGDAGYVTFELKDDGKIFRGSLEVLTVVRDHRTTVRFILQLDDRPDWQEVAMLTRLERKLRAELGSQTPGKDVRKDEAPKDAPKEAEPEPPKKSDGPPLRSTP